MIREFTFANVVYVVGMVTLVPYVLWHVARRVWVERVAGGVWRWKQ